MRQTEGKKCNEAVKKRAWLLWLEATKQLLTNKKLPFILIRTGILANDPAFVVLLDVASDDQRQLVLNVRNFVDGNDFAGEVRTLVKCKVSIAATTSDGSINNVYLATLAIELEYQSIVSSAILYRTRKKIKRTNGLALTVYLKLFALSELVLVSKSTLFLVGQFSADASSENKKKGFSWLEKGGVDDQQIGTNYFVKLK